jgi:hypothetical protein
MIPPVPTVGDRRYWAFISYSWTDKPFATALHRRFERFTIPRPIRKPLATRWGLPADRLRPVFRDDEEMPISGELDDRLRNAIDGSTAMVLLASPDSSRSRYVNDEVVYFVGSRGVDRLIVIAVGGEALQPPMWPPALRDRGAGLLWVDCRDGRRLDRRGLVRIVAAILGVNFDMLWQRHRRRQRRIVGALAATSVALIAAFGILVSQQQATERLSPERQRTAFEAFLVDELATQNRQFDHGSAASDVRYEILRGDDLNRDGLLDYVVSNQTPAACGSGGCSFEVYLTEAPGRYTNALQLLGASTPRLRDRHDGSAEIITTDYYVSREPLYSVYRLEGNAYELAQYEYCDGVIFEMCEPTVIMPVGRPTTLKVTPGTTVLQRPSADSGPATIGAGDSSSDLSDYDPSVIGVLANRQWYLVEVWKGFTGFVPAHAVLV